MVIGLYWVGRKYYPIPYEYIRLLKVILGCAVLYAAHMFIGSNWLWEIILLAAYPVILFASGFFNPREVAFAKRYLHLHGS